MDWYFEMFYDTLVGIIGYMLLGIVLLIVIFVLSGFIGRKRRVYNTMIQKRTYRQLKADAKKLKRPTAVHAALIIETYYENQSMQTMTPPAQEKKARKDPWE